jgi:uncharacterized membrane protein YbhN (UPF0104 family)
LKSTFIFILKLVVSVGTFYAVSRSIAWTTLGDVLINAKYSYMVFALAIFSAAQVFSSLRCVYVARVLGGELDLSTSIRAHFVGLWFNQVLPTSLGGDVVKIAILKNTLGLSIAIRSAILDRISGLMFLLLATAVALPLYVDLFPTHPELIFALGIIALGGGLIAVLGAWVAHGLSKSSILSPMLLKLLQIASDMWEFRKGAVLWGQMWTSAIVHFNGIFSYLLLGLALGIEVNPISFLLIVPVVFLIALIPVSFAGWGLREMGAVWLFGMVGITNESALGMSICFGLLLVVAGLPDYSFC